MKKYKKIECPESNLDINIIENDWSVISNLVYQNKQYINKDYLINGKLDGATKIDKNMIIGLYNSFQKRLINLIKGKGKRLNNPNFYIYFLLNYLSFKLVS